MQSFLVGKDGVLSGPIDTISSGGDSPAFTTPLSTGQVAVMNVSLHSLLGRLHLSVLRHSITQGTDSSCPRSREIRCSSVRLIRRSSSTHLCRIRIWLSNMAVRCSSPTWLVSYVAFASVDYSLMSARRVLTRSGAWSRMALRGTSGCKDRSTSLQVVDHATSRSVVRLATIATIDVLSSHTCSHTREHTLHSP